MNWKYIFLILLVLMSCSKTKVVQHENELKETDRGEQIIFLNYEIAKSDGVVTANMVATKIVGGKIKKQNNAQSIYNNGDLICVQMNDKSKALDSLIIINPLIKNIEYVNDSGRLERKQIELDSVKIPIRLQLHPSAKSISLLIFDNKKILLSKTSI